MTALNNCIGGYFTSDGNAKTLVIPCDVDHMIVRNYTQMATQQATGRGVEFSWQRGMADGEGFIVKKSDTTDVLNGEVITSGGFTLVDTSGTSYEAAVTITSISTAATPVVTTSGNHGYSTGDTVRIAGGTGALQIDGNEYVITVTGATTFTINQPQLAVAQTGGTVRRRKYPPQFYPRRHLVMEISNAASAVVTTSTAHGLTTGQLVSFRVPSVYGMTEADMKTATITAVGSTTTFTVNLNTSGYTNFVYPAAASYPFTKAQVIPFGDGPIPPNTAGDSAGLGGATIDQGYRGMVLAAGVDSPAGSSGDVIYWYAWKGIQYQTS